MPPADQAHLADLLARLDEDAARAVVASAASPGALVAAAHQELQQRLAAGEVGRPTAAAAAGICLRLLAAVAPPPAGGGGQVMVVSPLEDMVGAEAVACVLRSGGHAVDVIAWPLPAGELSGHTSRRQGTAMVVTATRSSRLPALAEAVSAGHRATVPAVATGPAFGPDDLRALRMGADAWAPDPPAVAGVLRRWQAAPPDVATAAAPSAELGWFHHNRMGLMAWVLRAAQPWAGAATETSDDEGLLTDVVDHLEAAVLVDDSRLLLDFLRPDVTASAGHLLEGLAAAVPADLDRTRAIVEDGLRHARLLCGQPPRPAAAVRPPGPAGPPDRGKVFNDLLLLGATAVGAPMALVSVRRGPGQWSTLSFGVECSDALSDPVILEFVAAHHRPVEVPDVNNHDRLASARWAKPPLAVRWLFGTPLVGRDGTALGVFCALDRERRQASRRDERALAAVARQLAEQLEMWRRPQAPPASVTPAAGRPAALASRRGAAAENHHLLRSQEVAALFDVTERTVINWAAGGKLPALRTIGGHLRFRQEDVTALLAGRRRGAAG